MAVPFKSREELDEGMEAFEAWRRRFAPGHDMVLALRDRNDGQVDAYSMISIPNELPKDGVAVYFTGRAVEILERAKETLIAPAEAGIVTPSKGN